MKQIFLCAALIVSTFITPIFAQNTIQTSATRTLLNSYYDIKNSLISSNSNDAKTFADGFLKVINDVDANVLPTTDRAVFITLRDKLKADAQHISESKNLAQQRDHFSNLSLNFNQLARLIKLSDEKIYYAYCPMKKSYWLSADAAIKNPYYGKAMLTCGKVVETLNK
jgi:hypothetical protein